MHGPRQTLQGGDFYHLHGEFSPYDFLNLPDSFALLFIYLKLTSCHHNDAFPFNNNHFLAARARIPVILYMNVSIFILQMNISKPISQPTTLPYTMCLMKESYSAFACGSTTSAGGPFPQS